jgi:hypothetical protein
MPKTPFADNRIAGNGIVRAGIVDPKHSDLTVIAIRWPRRDPGHLSGVMRYDCGDSIAAIAQRLRARSRPVPMRCLNKAFARSETQTYS